MLMTDKDNKIQHVHILLSKSSYGESYKHNINERVRK